MYAAALRAELLFRDSRSLKEKRRIVKSLTASLTNKFPVAVAEVGYQEQWQRCSLGVAVVAASSGQLDRMFVGVRRLLEQRPGVEVLDIRTSHLEDPA
jgi:uncharacterized protein YlxP (DUF503 family)